MMSVKGEKETLLKIAAKMVKIAVVMTSVIVILISVNI